MKRRELIKRLERNGWTLKREGADHTVYTKDGKIEMVPRHREINEKLAKAIVKKWGLQ